MNCQIQVVGWDFDDILSKSFEGFTQCHTLTAQALGLRAPTHEELRGWAGEDEFVRKLWPGFDPERYKSEYKIIAKGVQYEAVPDAIDTLWKLDAGDLIQYIVSNRPRHLIGLRFEQTRIPEQVFSGIFCDGDYPMRKPSPLAFQPMLARMEESNIHPRQAIYVGDEIKDFKAADGAGIPFYAITSGLVTREEFLDAGLPPTRILSSIKQVPRIVGL